MSEHFHAVVWIDHHQARIAHFHAKEADVTVVHPHDINVRVHHHAGTMGSGHVADDHKFLHGIASELNASQAILITGPADEKACACSPFK